MKRAIALALASLLLAGANHGHAQGKSSRPVEPAAAASDDAALYARFERELRAGKAVGHEQRAVDPQHVRGVRLVRRHDEREGA